MEEGCRVGQRVRGCHRSVAYAVPGVLSEPWVVKSGGEQQLPEQERSRGSPSDTLSIPELTAARSSYQFGWPIDPRVKVKP